MVAIISISSARGVRGYSAQWLTGERGGVEEAVGVGSRVERADAPVSPLNSPPRLLDFRRNRVLIDEAIVNTSSGRDCSLHVWMGKMIDIAEGSWWSM